MKRKLLFLTCLSGIGSMLSAQNVYIPDKVFKAHLLSDKTINPDGDTAISIAEAEATTRIYAYRYIGPRESGPNISDLSGIEKFSNLVSLELPNHYIQSVSLASNTKLKKLFLIYRGTTPINFAANTQLERLRCSLNQAELDLSTLTVLRHLDCSISNLQKLNVTQNASLKHLNVSMNKLAELDVTHNLQLDTLLASDNILSTLDLTRNAPLKFLDVTKNQLATLNVSKLTQLHTLQCSENKLSTLDLSNNLALKRLTAYKNELSSINFPKPNVLSSLILNFNKLTALDISGMDLNELAVYNNPELTTICVKSIVAAHRITLNKDLATTLVVCADPSSQNCTPHIGKFSGCEDFKDADPEQAGINEYMVETDKTKWDNGPVADEHAYMGMFWTEGSKDNGFSAVKKRTGNGSLEFTINQPWDAYEPIMLTFGSYAENAQEQKFTLDLSNNAVVAFDFLRQNPDDINFYVELEDIHGHSLALDKTYDTSAHHWYVSHIGYQESLPVDHYWSQKLVDGTLHNHFEYDFKDAVCAEKVIKDELSILKARPDIAFDYSKVQLVKLFVTGDPYDLYDYKLELKNFKIGAANAITSQQDHTVKTEENYTAYDLLGNYIGKGKESELKLKAGQIYILKSQDQVKKKFIVE